MISKRKNITFKITTQSFQCILRTQQETNLFHSIKGEIQFLLFYSKIKDRNDIKELIFSHITARSPHHIKTQITTKNKHQTSFSSHETSKNLKTEITNFGYVTTIWEKPFCGVYFLHIKPHKAIPLHVHKRTIEAEIALTSGLLLQGVNLEPGISHKWPLNFPHTYENKTDQEQIVLCINHPSFDPQDEIEQGVFAPPSEELPAELKKKFW